MDGREMPAKEFLKILDVEKPKKQWESFFGCLTHYRSLPTYLTSHQVQLMRILEAHRKTLNGVTIDYFKTRRPHRRDH